MDATGPAQARLGAAREQVLAALRERIVAFAASRLGRDVAEDLAQEVLLLLCEKYPEVERIEELLPLCLKIVRFKMVAQVRKSVRRGEFTQADASELPLADSGENPEALAARHELTGRLLSVIRRMGPRCKELLRLKLAGKTFAEIQALMGARSINTVYTWDFRCRKQALDSLGGTWEPQR
jgi:RNA polymerase sigma-70 factor (ECF subfamily)